MTYKQSGNNLDIYLVSQQDKSFIPNILRKPNTAWGPWGQLFTIGQNTSGELGIGTSTNSAVLNAIEAPLWVDVSCGRGHTLGIKYDGTLWAWGKNDSGQLGLGSGTGMYSVPIQVGSKTNWKSVFAGGYRSMALDTDGNLWGWGNNGVGQLGLGYSSQVNAPTMIQYPYVTWTSVGASGGDSTMAVAHDGTLWSWGSNTYGQLGLSDKVNYNSPTRVGTDTNWAETGGVEYFSVSRKTNGTLWASGYNLYGSLGQGHKTDSSSPVQVGTQTDWATVNIGDQHVLALKNDGTLWAWGRNSFGALGLGDRTDRSSPTQVGLLNNWYKIDGGSYYASAAIKTDGTAWAWGKNDYSKLVVTQSSSPLQVGSLTNWRLVYSGFYHSGFIQN